MTNIYRQPYLSVVVGGGTLTDVLAARVQAGYDQRVASAEVVARSLPAAAIPWGTVEITMGADQATAEQRFSGYFVEPQHELFEHTVRLNCKGKLQRAETFRAATDVDMTSYYYNQNNGISGYGHLDEVMVATVLYIVGITAGTWVPSGETTPADIGGAGRMMGSIFYQGFNWEKGESGLSFIEKIEDVGLGWRTFDGMDGTIKRTQISTIAAGSAQFTFTEGVDIYRATESDTVLESRNRVYVEGYNGDKTERTYTAEAANPWLVGSGTNPTTQWYFTDNISSPMIETATSIGGTVGISAREVASWKLAELNRRVQRVILTTPRDDLVEPGDTICVVAPTRLDITSRNYWVQNVDVSIDRRGKFSQVLTCIGSQDGGVYTEGVTATATAQAHAPTMTNNLTVVTSTATAQAIAPEITGGATTYGITATATATAYTPTITGGAGIVAIEATATAEAITPKITIPDAFMTAVEAMATAEAVIPEVTSTDLVVLETGESILLESGGKVRLET